MITITSKEKGTIKENSLKDVEMRQQHIVQILRRKAHACQPLVDRHPLWNEGMKERRHLSRENRGYCFGVIHALGTYIPAPTSVHKDQPLRVLDQIGKNGKRDPAFIRRCKLPGRLDQIEPFAEGNGGINANASALQHMNLHGIILLMNVSDYPGNQ